MYYNSLTNYSRFKTKQTSVGCIPLGENNPIRIQTMTNTITSDIISTTNQTISCFEAGADYVRITTPNLKDVKALKIIRIKLMNYLSDKPLIADIHFNPKIALEATGIAQKIRINPGNFVDKKSSIKTNYSDEEYQKELDKIEDKLLPIIEKCKKTKTSIRIGTNHGSLSSRIINKYGNTTKGLVESTLEFLNICKKNNFDELVVSIKASNPTIMIQANRLLVEEMKTRGMNYPIHLGVTEAGNNIEGRIKSALGIGALLLDGIGDTIRVSLTEKPENEIPIALKITKYIKSKENQAELPEIENMFFNPFSFLRRETYQIDNIGGNKVPIVIVDSREQELEFSDFLPDYILTSKREAGEYIMNDIKTIINFNEWDINSNCIPLMKVSDYIENKNKINTCFIELNYKSLNIELIKKINQEKNAVIIASIIGKNKVGELRLIFSFLSQNKCKAPVVIKFEYLTEKEEDFAIQAAIDCSIFTIDGLADGIYLAPLAIENKSLSTEVGFEILQASHRRLSKTEFISCPSCGRTLFNLEEVTQKIKKQISHLKGIKIAIMGCIVNGPGEVADADYGYIGSGKHTVSLFKGKNMIKKDIKDTQAVQELINLIKENGDWIEP